MELLQKKHQEGYKGYRFAFLGRERLECFFGWSRVSYLAIKKAFLSSDILLTTVETFQVPVMVIKISSVRKVGRSGFNQSQYRACNILLSIRETSSRLVPGQTPNSSIHPSCLNSRDVSITILWQMVFQVTAKKIFLNFLKLIEKLK